MLLQLFFFTYIVFVFPPMVMVIYPAQMHQFFVMFESPVMAG